ncbi:hypothetical protein CP556_08655 [Natrinema sp. CBA1119]|nr:hypothetical protein CP556_08655 [Natrinema sp. CBA1119]
MGELLKEHIDPVAAETIKTVLGGAYGGLALRLTMEDSVSALIFGPFIFLATYVVFRIIRYANTDQEYQAEMLLGNQQSKSSTREVGSFQLRQD